MITVSFQHSFTDLVYHQLHVPAHVSHIQVITKHCTSSVNSWIL